MAFLNTSQIQEIKLHMIEGDSVKLKTKYKSKKNQYDSLNIELNEIEDYEKQGWEVATQLKRKAKIQRKKEIGRQFEDDIWCMFYNLGFEYLNWDENLTIQWGSSSSDHKQLDVVAVGDDAIFVVECKASEKRRTANFKTEIENMILYKDGVTKALRQIYGENKKVKFIFATRGYIFSETSEDVKRLNEKKIYHFNENSYNYVTNLIKSYKSSVIYQFYGLMFKDEKINNELIRVPAVKGTMGGHDYYMLSIEPSKLLKIGFVLHRTKVNDSMAPTYQRMLVPSRLKGITKFIDEGGYFPNTIIVNFEKNNKFQVSFENSGKSDDSKSRIGYLLIPNAYGIAYIIDGQHRVYGYANSKYKNTNTVPVVAFSGLESDEQLKIFMDINENQKAVSPSLRLDLAEDLNWDSTRLDSRLVALRSSIIKQLSRDSNSILYGKISIGEDNAKLTFPPFENALKKTSLLPKAAQKSYIKDMDVCLYDCKNLEYDKVMKESRKRISNYIRECYAYMNEKLSEDIYKTYIECNRGTYAFIVFIGSMNEFLIQKGILGQNSPISEQITALSPYFNVLSYSLENLPDEDKNAMSLIKGQGADTLWLRKFQEIINKQYNDYNPDGLEEWKEMQDKGLQEEGKKVGEDISKILHIQILRKLEDLYGSNWEKQVVAIKGKCLQRIGDSEDNIAIEDWSDYMEVEDYQEIIEKHWQIQKPEDKSFITFEEEFSIKIKLNDSFKSKKDKLKWMSDYISLRKSWTTAKGKPLNRSQLDELYIIRQNLKPVE